MKKAVSFLLAIVLVISMGAFSLTANAVDTYTEGYYTYTVSNGEATITDVDESISGDITIPDTLGGYPVTSIAKSAFSYCSKLTSIIIPEGVTSIGEKVFNVCSNLKSITLPSSVTSISGNAFLFCVSLSEISINPNNNYYCSVDGVLFNKDKTTIIKCPQDKNDTSYNIPKSVTSIGNYAFFGCESLTSIVISNSATNIGDYAFSYCYGLTSIIIPNSVTSIGREAFSNCDSLTSITTPDSVISIGEWAFYSCDSLTNITIGNSVTSIGTRVFSDCDSLTGIKIGNSVTSIGDDAFSNCDSLTSIIIPNSVTSIGEYAFYSCKSLTSITIPGSVTSIGSCSFASCKKLESIILSNGLLNICEYSFAWCDSLKSVTIPDSVVSIDNSAFYYCSSLTNVVIGNGVTSIGDYVFSWCSSLESVTLPNNTSIGRDAFVGCQNLHVVFFRGSAEEMIKYVADAENTGLTNVVWYYDSCIGASNHTYDNNCDGECNVCGDIRNTMGHRYDEHITEATCTTDGYIIYYCVSCGDKYTVDLPANGHAYDDDLDAVCNECGFERDTKIHGDTNGDGAFDAKDYSALMQYLNEWDGVVIDLDAADVNGDGKLNGRDCSLMLQYFNGWDVELK